MSTLVPLLPWGEVNMWYSLQFGGGHRYEILALVLLFGLASTSCGTYVLGLGVSTCAVTEVCPPLLCPAPLSRAHLGESVLPLLHVRVDVTAISGLFLTSVFLMLLPPGLSLGNGPPPLLWIFDGPH